VTVISYFANPSTPAVREAMTDGLLGCIVTPDQGNRLDRAWAWIADNGCFSEKWKAGKWLGFLADLRPAIGSCVFAVVPDVVADHAATLRRWDEWAPVVRALGYPLAFVLQDGATVDTVPWKELDAVFIGGSTEFKLSTEAHTICAHARLRGCHVHMGRVNTLERLTYAAEFCDSADGTYIAFGPDVNLPKMLRYLRTARALAAMPRLWEASA
jgi:hypothetical protein